MNRTSVYKTPQFALALIGSWLILAGTIGLLASDDGLSDLPATTGSSTTLKVVPATKLPGASIDALQGAGGLQGQSTGALQRSGVADRLQPNAKTDTFTDTDKVQ